jgi:hypothetical protein
VRKADDVTSICEPIIYKMWDPQLLTTLWASTVCYRDNLLYIFVYSDSHCIAGFYVEC